MYYLCHWRFLAALEMTKRSRVKPGMKRQDHRNKTERDK